MKKTAAAAAVALLTLSPALHAAEWTLSFTATGTVWGVDADLYPLTELQLHITTEDTLSTSPVPGILGQGYRITSFSGTRNGQAVTAIFSSALPFYSYGIDNYLYPANPQLIGDAGLAYSAGGVLFNLYGSTISLGGELQPPQWFEMADLVSSNPNSPTVFFSGTTTVSAVPEPAAWALMLAGLALTAGRARRRAF